MLFRSGWVQGSHWSHAVLIRGGIADPTIYKIDLDGILAGKKPNVMLAPGDVVYLPKDDISEFNVFVNKLMPTAQLFNMITTPITLWKVLQTND